MPQYHRNGEGFILHRLTNDSFSGRFSAWFDKDGNLLDAEQILPHRRGERAVPVGPSKVNIRAWLKVVGSVWKRPK